MIQYAAPDCQCGGRVELTYGSELFPHRPDLTGRPFYVCRGCGSRVGCHPGTTRPLGELADEATRKARNDAHRAFDPLWKRGLLKREQAYAWLAANLGVPVKACHIANFDRETCEMVVALCREMARGMTEDGRTTT